MRIVVQRVLKCAVHVEERLVSEIGKGVLALVGFERGDDASVLDFGVKRVVATRYFDDETSQKSWAMSATTSTTGHSVMLVSQFTLFGEPVKGKGNRLDFSRAMPAAEAKVLFDEFVRRVEAQMTAAGAAGQVRCGEFGAPMRVALENDGPCTIIIEKRTKEAEEKDINKQPAATTDE
jgi:D-tyrosyl-tRNA(Tyr) deacylase